jgi:plasmid stability protein
MASLIVRNLDDKVVRKLKEQAAKYGVSMEEQHRRILRGSLLKKKKASSAAKRKLAPKMSLLDYLCTMPYFGDDDTFEFKREMPRKVDL